MPPKKQKKKHRLKSDERREAILESVLPVFAEQGFRATTTKMLAKSTGVSEALLYHHFPSKEALYTEVQTYLCRRYPALERAIANRPAGTETLVFFVFLLCQMMIDPPSDLSKDAGQVMPRLMLQSILDDGKFARLHFESNVLPFVELAAKSIAAAKKAGDVVGGDGAPDDLRFLLAHHVIVMVNLGRLTTPAIFNYPKSGDKLVDHVVRFVLRGIGVSDAAVARCFDAKRLKAELLAVLDQELKPG